MNIRKLRPREDLDYGEESEKKETEKPRRTRIKKSEEREKNPLSGALALSVLVGIGILFFFTTFTNNDPQVKGVQTEKEREQLTKQASQAASTIRGRFEDRIDSIKEQVTELDASGAVESPPQIEKIIKDLEALQTMPQESVENACHAMCDAIDQR